MIQYEKGVSIEASTRKEHLDKVLTREAIIFLTELHRKFCSERKACLERRQAFMASLHAQISSLSFLEETKHVREGSWKIADIPFDLEDRRVEITGPTDAKMMINALNSGAKVFMADLEDATSPTWENILQGQVNLMDAVRLKLSFKSDQAKEYVLKDEKELAALLVRPRAWHLEEKHFFIDDEPISASLFDFGLYFFHNALERKAQAKGCYFYLPKMEHYLEARLWDEVFSFSEKYLDLPLGTIRATCLIETLPAAYQMDEILFELKDHILGLNAGRWDYIFSTIKCFRYNPNKILPDRSQVTMQVDFMKAYSNLLVKTCHKRGAHAIGGMAAFIPSRKDMAVNEVAISKVTEDKQIEANAGFDGTWVAHPDLVPVASKVFTKVLGDQLNQKHILREDVQVTASDLSNLNIPAAKVSEAGIRSNICVALQYLNYWLLGYGAVALNHLMEDAATAEISRAQLWQWIKHGVKLEDGRQLTMELYQQIKQEELSRLANDKLERLEDAVTLLDELVLAEVFVEFLTLPAYRYL